MAVVMLVMMMAVVTRRVWTGRKVRNGLGRRCWRGQLQRPRVVELDELFVHDVVHRSGISASTMGEQKKST